MTALLAGEVDMFFSTTPDVMPHIGSDRIRVLATTGASRLAKFPDLPCISEQFPGFVVEPWNGYIGPPAMPRDLVDRIAEAVMAASKHPTVVERLAQQEVFPVGSSPAQFAETIASDRVFYAEAIKVANIQPG